MGKYRKQAANRSTQISTSKQGERTLTKQDHTRRRFSELMNEFSQAVPVPICKRSIQRRLSNLWLSQENCSEKTDDFVENRKKSCTMVPKQTTMDKTITMDEIIFSDEMWC